MWNNCVFEREKINDSIYRTLSDSLNSNEKLILVGEDIQSPYGGAFKITRNLSDRFQERVRNTPISEAALAGLGNGLALAGMLPVVEIMFGDFITLTADQWINHAAILNTLYDSQIRVPIILRTPMGGKRGYGPTHSQCLEKHFLGVPGTQVLCLHHRYSGRLLYEALFENIDRPTLVIENKSLYGRYADPDPPAGYQLLRTDESFPWVRLKPCANPDLTLVAIGGMSCDAEEAMKILFEEHELIVELFFPSRLYPLDIQVLKDSITHSGRLLVAEEGQGFVSLTSEILAQVHERFGGQGLRCRRVAAQPGPVPAARPLEQFHLPGAIQIVTAALNLMEDDSD